MNEEGSAQCATHCSISCYPNVNIVLGAGNCEALILPSTVSNAISESCNKAFKVVLKDKDEKIIPKNMLTSAHVGMEISFHLSNHDLNCENFCWGRITVENKNLPPIGTSTVSGMCGADHLTFSSLEKVQESLDTLCTVPVRDLTEEYEYLGDKCTEQTTIRTVRGWVDIDGVEHVIVRMDTVILMKLDTTMVICPGSPDFQKALEIDCHLTDEYPSPEVIAKYFHDTLAYPWIDKGSVETERDTFVVLDFIRETTVDEKIELSDGVWAIFPVVTKTPVYKDSIVVDSMQLYITILPGTKECNLTTQYSDQIYKGCTGEGGKILREWTILDWCSGEIKMCQQWIIITDKTAPWIKILEDNVMVNVTPWTCKATIDIAEYFEVKGGCTAPTYYLHSNSGVLEGTVLSGLMLTENPVEVYIKATNGCNAIAYDTLTLQIKDLSAPVAIATDLVQVTLTGDPYETEIGIGKVYVDDIDAGSHDSGCGEIEKCLLLDEELQDPIVIEGKHISDKEGNLLYHQHQCGDPDGIYYILDIFKEDTTIVDEIPYVICKEFVKFCCEDIPKSKVALVVSDESPYSPDGYSWSDVTIEDKSIPIMQCEDIEVACGYDYSPEVIGYPTIYHPICNKQELSYVDDEDVDACGYGAVLRLWSYGDYALCTQRITFRIDKVFDPMLIKWPKHYNGDTFDGKRRECEVLKDDEGAIIYDYEYDDHGDLVSKTPQKGIIEYNDYIEMGDPFECGVTEQTGEPVWCNETCGLMGSSYEDVSVEAGESCKKIIRKWTIIDWCIWRPNGSNVDDENDTYQERFEMIDDEWLTDLDCKECEKESGVPDNVYLRYREGRFDYDGYYTYDQVLKVVDYTAPAIDVATRDTVEISTGALSKNDTFEDCINTGTVTARAVDVCGLDQVIHTNAITWSIVTKDENGVVIAGPKHVIGAEATMTTGTGAAGTFHEIIWKATDACGNSTILNTLVEFADTKNPTPVCIQDLSTSAMNTDGTVEIWAEDFDRGSFDNCGDVKLAFLVDENGDQTIKVEEGTFLPSITLECDDLTAGLGGTVNLEMYAIDNYGNYDYCAVRLRIDDNADACPDGNIEAALIAGALFTEAGEMVEEANVSLNDDKSMSTDLYGKYGFNNSALGGNYMVVPAKDGDVLNGVTILDVYLIERHVLGVSDFKSPYKTIAADVNADEKISALDLVELRKVILGIRDEFPNNKSWRFVDATQTFLNAMKPWPLVEHIEIEDLSINMRKEDFVGVKIGDVNSSAIANSTILGKGRSGERLQLVAEDRNIAEGETFEVSISNKADIDLVGFQWTLKHENTQLLSVNGNAIELSEDNYNITSNDVHTMSWNPKGESKTLNAEEALFTLTFRANKSLKLSESISINSNKTIAVAYNKELEA
ncbi:MAG: hypothetical protein ACI9FN_002942, partial [Saprospiraceae bacterium]